MVQETRWKDRTERGSINDHSIANGSITHWISGLIEFSSLRLSFIPTLLKFIWPSLARKEWIALSLCLTCLDVLCWMVSWWTDRLWLMFWGWEMGFMCWFWVRCNWRNVSWSRNRNFQHTMPCGPSLPHLHSGRGRSSGGSGNLSIATL